MSVKSEKIVFYHIPKTGGIWAKEAMKKAGITLSERRDFKFKQGLTHRSCWHRTHLTPENFESIDLFSFCFIRHPVQWYKSFWGFRRRHRLRRPHKILIRQDPLEYNWSKDFNRFLSNMLDEFPDGYLTGLFKMFTSHVNFVGKQENLVDDLVTALKTAGENFDEKKLRATEPKNVGQMSPDINSGLHERLLKSESEIIEKYYESRTDNTGT